MSIIPNRTTGPGDPLGMRLRFVLLGGLRDGVFVISALAIVRACS